VDVDGRPHIEKLGTVDVDMVETTPVVFRGKLYRFDYMDKRYKGNTRGAHFRFLDLETGEHTPPFADGHHLGSAFVEGDTVYVTGSSAWGGQRVEMFASQDLENWESWNVLDLPGFAIFNTSMCKVEDEYVLMFEISKPKDQAGHGFTARFARSKDLKNWELTPPECVYDKTRYSAPHVLRYFDGYYYNFYLAGSHETEWVMEVARSVDLIHWETSPLNPVMRGSDEDRVVANADLTPAERKRAAEDKNNNNSDVDWCEYEGRLILFYCWGNQQGDGLHLGKAVYDGTEEQFLKGWFPAKRPR